MSTAATFENLKAFLGTMPIAQTLGLRCTHIEAGTVIFEMPVQDAFCFRPGQMQATPVFGIADFAAVAAGATLLPPGASNATIDTTLKLLAPARGQCLRAHGRVVRAGQTFTVCASDVYAVDAEGKETLCATLLATAQNMPPRP